MFFIASRANLLRLSMVCFLSSSKSIGFSSPNHGAQSLGLVFCWANPAIRQHILDNKSGRDTSSGGHFEKCLSHSSKCFPGKFPTASREILSALASW